jgi:hypothetical protein
VTSTFFLTARAALALGALTLAGCAAPEPVIFGPAAPKPRGALQVERYGGLLAKARVEPLAVADGEPGANAEAIALHFAQPADLSSETFTGSYRPEAKTSFAAGTPENHPSLGSIFDALPNDEQMARQFPALLSLGNNHTPRVAPEKRNVRVHAWIYRVAWKGDRDFQVVLGDTPQLTSTTTFVNCEISGLPRTDPARAPFAARRADIRAILAEHRQESGLFYQPVPVSVAGSLLWDGEHRAHHSGPDELKPKTAWEIHPIQEITDKAGQAGNQPLRMVTPVR